MSQLNRTKPSQIHELFSETKIDIFLVKPKLSKAKKDKTVGFSRIFHDYFFKVKKVEIDVEDAEAVVEDVDSEFNHFADEEEFEGFHNEEDEEDEFEHMTTKGKEKLKSQFFSC